jgi:F-type H+-transporting ATPase subunit f
MFVFRFFVGFALQSGGSGEGLAPLVNFYSKLPKGPASASGFRGIKARFFEGKNASSLPVWGTILGLFALGYTIDYQSWFTLILFIEC